MLENKIFSILFFLTVLLRHGIRHAVRIFYSGCLALLALWACVTQARFASNPYGAAIFCLDFKGLLTTKSLKNRILHNSFMKFSATKP